MWFGNGTCCQFSESDLQLFSNLRGIPSLGHSAEYNPVQPLESLPGYKRWIVQTPYPPLRGVLTRVILIDYRTFLLHQISTPPSSCSPIPTVSSLISLYSASNPFCSHPYKSPEKSSISLSQKGPRFPQIPLLYLIFLGL